MNVFQDLPKGSSEARAEADAVFTSVRNAYAEYKELGGESSSGPVRLMNAKARDLAFDLARGIEDGVVELAFVIRITVGECDEARR